jgi:hypothetical protein
VGGVRVRRRRTSARRTRIVAPLAIVAAARDEILTLHSV